MMHCTSQQLSFCSASRRAGSRPPTGPSSQYASKEIPTASGMLLRRMFLTVFLDQLVEHWCNSDGPGCAAGRDNALWHHRTTAWEECYPRSRSDLMRHKNLFLMFFGPTFVANYNSMHELGFTETKASCLSESSLGLPSEGQASHGIAVSAVNDSISELVGLTFLRASDQAACCGLPNVPYFLLCFVSVQQA